MLELKGQRLFFLSTYEKFSMSLPFWVSNYCSEGEIGWVFHLPNTPHILVVYLGLFCSYVSLAYSGQFSVAVL